jgi:hypothetical protein
MKPESSPSAAPATPAPTGEAAAAAYIAQELPKARKALRRARIIGLVLIGLIGGYISIISVTLVRFFQPQAAAQVASGMVLERVASDGPALALQIERQIPLLIRQAPDYVIRQLPGYREQAELVLETELQSHCATLSTQVGKQMDDLIATHEANLKTLLEHPNDRAVLRTVLPDLDQTITSFLTTDADGKVVQEHIADLAAALKEVEKRMDRLANGANLTPEEKKARRSLAVMAKAIKDKTTLPETSPAPVGKLASK